MKEMILETFDRFKKANLAEKELKIDQTYKSSTGETVKIIGKKHSVTAEHSGKGEYVFEAEKGKTYFADGSRFSYGGEKDQLIIEPKEYKFSDFIFESYPSQAKLYVDHINNIANTFIFLNDFAVQQLEHNIRTVFELINLESWDNIKNKVKYT